MPAEVTPGNTAHHDQPESIAHRSAESEHPKTSEKTAPENTQPEQPQLEENAQRSKSTGDSVTELEHAIIALETKNWRYQGRKEQAILNLGLSPIAYYQKLNSMIDDPRIIARYPVETDAWRARRENNF